ncbi:MAG TPA: DUF177 domain-containing protein [Gemmatimonadales bacterium]|nr:DUF177 domain-containing protein [Gemmatimonadales bacterium]
MLEVDIRELRHGPVETTGELAAADPLFEGLEVPLDGPLSVGGTLERAGQNGFFWHGRFDGQVRSVCRRCLTEFVMPVAQSVEVMFSPDPDLQDDPSVYPLAEQAARVDVRPAVREELALAVDYFPLCREDCRGLCPRCGADLNRGACTCTAPSA